MLVGKWNMIGVKGNELDPGEVNILTFSDDGSCCMQKKRGEGDDLRAMEAVYEYDETARQVSIKQDGEVVSQFDVIELTDTQMVMQMGPNVLTFERT